MEQNIIAGPEPQELGNIDRQRANLLSDPLLAKEERADINSPLVNARILSFRQITA